MSRFISAAVDKFRSDMVDYYIGSWFKHKKANAVVVLRDGLAGPAQMSIRHIEIRENQIILTFDNIVVGGRGGAAVASVRPPTLAADSFCAATVAAGAPDALFSISDDEDEEPLYESMSRGSLRRRNALHSAYSAETVDSNFVGGIEMKALPRSRVSLEERIADSETRFKTTGV
jgi:hypothetical protein